MYCYQCGKQVEEDVKFCPYCGAQLNSHDQNNGNGYNPINQNYQGSYQKPDDESSFGGSVSRVEDKGITIEK